MLTWLWLSAVAILFGAEINAESERSRELRQGKPAERELTAPAKGSPGFRRPMGRAYNGSGPRSSADRAADFESACGGSIPPGAILRIYGKGLQRAHFSPPALIPSTSAEVRCSALNRSRSGAFWRIRQSSGSGLAPSFRRGTSNLLPWRASDGGAGTSLETETRVLATNPGARTAFQRYWLVIRPASGLIRRIMLGAIARRATRARRMQG